MAVGGEGEKPRVHFCGIGGTGMVAGAQLAVELGWEVRGSDNPLYPPTSTMVEALGVPVAVGYDVANLDWHPDLVIVGNALSRGNPEVEAVLERHYPYVSLPEWLKENILRRHQPVIVISGTHGKTTTSAIAAFLLDRAGLEPGFFIGGEPLDFPKPARAGKESGPFVIEGDEYDTAFFDKRSKFFHYLPDMAVVTSLEFDHGDIFPDIEAIEAAFRLFLRLIPRPGWLVVCADDVRAAALAQDAHSRAITYGLSQQATIRGEFLGQSGGMQRLAVYKEGRRWGEFTVPLPGRHNLRNVLAALAVADILGLDVPVLAEALREVRGVRRRLEVFLEADGVTFIDDFAHHPTAIRETVHAVRSRWPARRLLVLLEPRSNTMVTKRFQEELPGALADADEVCIGPIYRADRIPEENRLDRARLVEDLRKTHTQAWSEDRIEAIVDAVRTTAHPGDIVLILSNGAFGGIYDLFRVAFSRVSASTEERPPC